MTTRKFLAIVVLGALLVPHAYKHSLAASFTTRGDAGYSIEGEIVQGDAKRFESIVASRCKHSSGALCTIYLDSPGGDIDEAMAIGKQIRARSLATTVYLGRSCASACVLIFVAGVERHSSFNSTSLIVHRPYLAASMVDRAAADREYKNMARRVRAYLVEMNVAPQLADEMFSVPPSEAKELSAADIKRLGLLGKDPGYEETVLSQNADLFGISKQQYLERTRQAREKCDKLLRGSQSNASEHTLCRFGVLLNASEQEVRRRFARVDEVCTSSVTKSNAANFCERQVLQGKR